MCKSFKSIKHLIIAVCLTCGFIGILFVGLRYESTKQRVRAIAYSRVAILDDYLCKSGIERFANSSFFQSIRPVVRMGNKVHVHLQKIDGSEIYKKDLPVDFKEKLEEVGVEILDVVEALFHKTLIIIVRPKGM